MAKFDLNSQGNKNIQTTFRYEVVFPTVGELGLSDQLTGYCTSAQLPKAMQEAIIWHQPFGMQNHQAGKRTIEPVQLEFVVPSTNEGGTNMYNMLSMWCHSTYDLNTGLSTGKGRYAVDGVKIVLKNELGIAQHTFELLRAFPTQVDYGTVSSEGSELLRVSMTLIYDNFKRNNSSITI